jgi:hypothetical protein
MLVFNVGAIEFDRCPFCRGLWFDAGELEQVLQKNLVGVLDSAPTSRACAQCRTPMRTVELGGLQVDVCTTCRGVFLDDGELVRLNGGQPVRVQAAAPAAAPRPEAQVKDELMGWLDTMGAGAPPAPARTLSSTNVRGIVRAKATAGDLETTVVECPQCNTAMSAFTVQSRKPGVDVELDRCDACGGVWFDAGELEAATGRTVVKSARTSDRFCPRCLIPLLNAELTGAVAVESCRTCQGTYLDGRDVLTVSKGAPVKPPEDVKFVCAACKQRKPFATAEVTDRGTVCADCHAGRETTDASSTLKSFVGWLRRD